MRERINRLARGIVDAELPKLHLSQTSVEETLVSETTYTRELFITSENNLYIKGLAYSSHTRVKILNSAFGGLRNHLTYEVDTSWCENGDEIKGSIYLVTNSGELEVPFIFHVEMPASLRVLSNLKTVEDFVDLAQKDMDLALRLMEYRDFIEAPFMQDMHVRTVYDGLKGHGNRQNALEEFFLALGVKKPIELTLSTARKVYDNPVDVISDKVVLRKNTWGYIYIEVRADGEFIELPKKVITQADFEDDRFDLRFKIHPERMHKGKNIGAIKLLTVHGDTVIHIEAMGDTTVDITGREHEISKASICRYLKLREDYESKTYVEAQTLNKLQKELDAIRGANGNSLVLSLLQAETYLDAGRVDQAALCLDDCREDIMYEREKFSTLFCFYQYLLYRTKPEPEKKEHVLRLFRKKLDDKKGRFYLQMLMMKLQPPEEGDEPALFESFKQQYKNGCHSPFLYIETCKLLEAHPELLNAMDTFEIHALYYGAQNGMIGEQLAAQIAAQAPGAKFYHRLYYKLLITLYERFPTKEMLTAICCLLIKGNKKSEDSFAWYEKGIEEEISLTRLYEYFLYSLPKYYEKMMPKQVLLYFSYEHTHLDRRSRSRLYKNILLFVEPGTKLYKSYERSMEQFAMEQLFESRINSRLAVIYKHMIYRDIIDPQVAKVLPAILKSNRISCEDSAMKYVIVCNELLTGEDAYPLQDGVAYVPLFFDASVIMFQDSYGNRYVDIPYTKEAVMDEPELEEKCFEMYPDHPMLKMRACQEIMEKEEIDAEEAYALECALDELPVKPLYQQKMLTKIISFYKSRLLNEDEAMEGDAGDYLLRLDKQKLSRDERVDICETLISQNYFAESYDMIRKFGEDKIRKKRLLKLCTKMILQNLFDEDELLLHLSYRVFAAGHGDSVILDYLCEHYNGTSEAMYKILVQAVREHVETYDLEERLLAQLMFSGSDKYLDTVFDFYASRKKTSDIIVRAYFTLKSVGYFLQDKVPGDKVFAYLEGAVNSSSEMRKVPEIYILALTKYYSSLASLNDEQKALCKRAMSVLTDQGMIFAYFKKLAPYADIPGDIMDKEIIEYHGSPAGRPILMVRILPDEEVFHEEELRMVYKGIYIRQKLLFEGEIMEYEVYEDENGTRVKKAEGDISCTEVPAGDKRNRFSCLNTMSLHLGTKDDLRLKETMTKYVTDNLAVEKLFPLA